MVSLPVLSHPALSYLGPPNRARHATVTVLPAAVFLWRSGRRSVGLRIALAQGPRRLRLRYQDSFPWHELLQVRFVAFQPMLLAARFLMPLLWVAASTVVEL